MPGLYVFTLWPMHIISVSAELHVSHRAHQTEQKPLAGLNPQGLNQLSASRALWLVASCKGLERVVRKR